MRAVEQASSLQGAPALGLPLRIERQRHAAATRIAPHAHAQESQLLTPEIGVLRVMTENQIWTVPPGKGLLIPTGVAHEVLTPIGAEVSAVLFSPAALPLTDCRMIACDRLVAELIAAIRPRPADEATLRLMQVLLDRLAEAPEGGPAVPRPRDPRLATILQALMDEPALDLTVEDWARRVGASPRSLARLMQTQIGMGLRDLRRQVRLQAALVELASDRPMAAIAADVGYDSQSAFIQSFRRLTGRTPGKSRKGRKV